MITDASSAGDGQGRPRDGNRLPLWASLTMVVLVGLILVLLGLLAR